MRKLTAISMALLCALLLAGCSASWIDPEIQNSTSVEITVYDNGEACAVYTVSSPGEVAAICQTFASLSAEQLSYHKPAMVQYRIRFLSDSGTELQSIRFLFGNTVVTNGQIYGITDDIHLLEYVSSLVFP